MGLFDFLKKKEFDEIKRLQNEIEKLKDASNSEISDLKTQLVRYSALSAIEKEVEFKKGECAMSSK